MERDAISTEAAIAACQLCVGATRPNAGGSRARSTGRRRQRRRPRRRGVRAGNRVVFFVAKTDVNRRGPTAASADRRSWSDRCRGSASSRRIRLAPGTAPPAPRRVSCGGTARGANYPSSAWGRATPTGPTGGSSRLAARRRLLALRPVRPGDMRYEPAESDSRWRPRSPQATVPHRASRGQYAAQASNTEPVS